MRYEDYEKGFQKKAKHYSKDEIKRCLEYAKPLIDQGLPVIFNTSHLSSLVGYTKNYLKRASLHTPFFYRQFEISKKNGSKRVIYEPLPNLKEIQQWILKNILYKIPISDFAKAYIPKKGIREHVKCHQGFKKIVTLDIENFFPSIKRERVEKVFKKLGYSTLIANLLSKLCSLNESIPQGASTSPYLSNIILKDFDQNVGSYCTDNGICYTRYADDLTFSGNIFYEKELIEFIEANLKQENFKLNHHKTKIMTNNLRQVVTGIVVNEKIQVPKTKRKGYYSGTCFRI
ncbi:MAG: reverse transcriptase family protein [Microscillaceae bacterium]|nr:reverse transcriptase family protein [Microscillaceae bacterium]